MRFIFNLVFFEPLYNALVWLTDILPGGDIGVAIIILTLVVRFILFPLQHRMTKTQVKLKELDGEIKQIKEKHKKDQTEQARALMALYRAHGISPFSGFLLLLIQLPILWALFRVFQGGFDFQPELLYGFVPAPETVNPDFLGLFDLTVRSLPLAILAGLAQFGQMYFALPPTPKRAPTDGTPSLKDDLARSMNLQMRYFFPVLIVVFSLGLPAAVPLYWLTTSVFSLLHELIVKRRSRRLGGQVRNLTPTASATN